MVDLGGGAREHFQSINVEEPLPPISSVGYTHTGQRSASWQPTLQGQDTSSRLGLLDSVPHNLIQIKSDPENFSGLCISSNNGDSLVPLSGPCLSPAEMAEDAQVKGQLLQEISRVAETFGPHNPTSLPSTCYRSYSLSSDTQPHSEYIFADTNQWCWSHSPTDDKSLIGHSSGSLLANTGSSTETVINSLQYNVPSHLVSDAFSSPLPSVSTTQSPVSVPSGVPVQRLPPSAPPLSSTLTSSALDLSPCPPPVAHQLPALQPSLTTATTSHMTLGSPPPSTHQLPALHPSLIPLEVPSQTFPSHDTLDDTLGGLVGVEGPEEHDRMLEYECGECGATFTRLPHLKYHIKIHAAEVEKSSDKQDNIKQDATNPKFTAQSPEKLFSCKHCDEKFSKAEKLKTHELKHSGDRPFCCTDCGTSFSAKAMLIRHRKVHTGEKPYKCDICKTCFTEAGSLKVHKRLHSGEKPFKCDQCDVAFSGAGMLATHKRKHTGERPYMCAECGETFRLLSTLKSHRRRHTGEKPFVCELCGSSFTQRAAMQRHKRIHSDQKPWECDQCGYKFREKENLRKHIALHKIKLQHMCNICGAGFNQAKKLETHKMLHNGGDRPYQCNKCPSTFTNPKYLTQHKKRVHDRKGAIRCEECNGTFKRKETLRSHMRIHKGERPYVCEECGAAFNQRGTLTKHIRVHGNQMLSNNESKRCAPKSRDKTHANTDDQSSDKKEAEMEINCSLCKLNFLSQKELLRHMMSNHMSHKNLQGTSLSDQEDDSSEHIRDKYVCEDCDQTFFRKRQLKAHKKYCPCRCLSPEPESPERVDVTTTVHNNTKEVDAMKLLTAVLAVTGNNPDEVSGFHHSLSTNEQVSSVSTAALQSSSLLTVDSSTENHHDRHVSFRLFPACDSSYTDHLPVLDHSPHMPHSPQSHHSLTHQASQDHHHLESPHLSLEHLHQDQLHHSSHIHPSDHDSDHILLSQSFEHHHSSRQGSHPQQQSSQVDSHLHLEAQDDSKHLVRSHSNILQEDIPQQDHLQLLQRQYPHLQDPLRDYDHISLPLRHQDSPDQATRPQFFTSKESELSDLSCGMNPSHQTHLKQSHTQEQHHNSQIDLIVQGQFYKSPPLLLTSQHLHHHHLPYSEHISHNAHLEDHPHQILPDIKDCDELARSLQHHDLGDTDNCHCQLSDNHDQHLPHHFSEHDLNDDGTHLHHQQADFCPALEGPNDIKREHY